MKLPEDRMLCRFPINLIYKTNPLFVIVGFFDGEEESCNFIELLIKALTPRFTFWRSPGGVLQEMCS